MEQVAGYFASVLIGISLGLIGGGGSILTVPVLVFLFHIDPTLATAYSLFIVGITSMVGGIRSAIHGAVDFRVAAIFSVPSLFAVYLTRRFILPAIPNEFRILTFDVSKDSAILVLFALIMIAAAIAMIQNKPTNTDEQKENGIPLVAIVVEGTLVGFLTGIVGAGGGFLIIPALVIFAKLSMQKAVGTSLIIIAAKSLIGFLGDIGSGQPIKFGFIGIVSAIAIAGLFIGLYFSQRLSSNRLKEVFGWIVLLAGTSMVVFQLMGR